ncbi:Phosphomevalonate kinase [Hysterangium stoloniferum]|nr:Phosphomevalonate kinase [Hysterangium stoloniferum]
MTIVVSAPGKVLITGGYLVLDPKYSGTVISTSSRFYTVVQESSTPFLVQVRSPQFIRAEWEAQIDVQEDGRVAFHDANEDDSKSLSKNKFVSLAIQKVLMLVAELKGTSTLKSRLQHGIDITIVGDNDFYSQRAYLASHSLPATLESLEKIPPFAPSHVTLGEVHKTGLGSSAALITSLVTALLLRFSLITSDALVPGNNEGKSLAHNVAQFVHCLAQGKVGSGFDVSSAVFGSHIYKRFDPAVIAPLMSENTSDIKLSAILSPSNKAWNHKIAPIRLPPGMRLMLADVDAGSDTPSLIGKVLQWRKENQLSANELWDNISFQNEKFTTILTELLKLHVQDVSSYDLALAHAASHAYTEVIALYFYCHQFLTRAKSQKIRNYMRYMSVASSAPIEPLEQTRLLDACLQKPGVVAGGVPGAGGYDAIWLLVIDSQPAGGTAPVAFVEDVWSKWTELNVSPLHAVESRGGGLRAERVEDIRGLSDVLNRC